MEPEIEMPRDRYARGITVHHREMLNLRANFACEIIRNISMCAILPAGENVRLLTPEECAKRGCEISEHAWKTFAENGWIIETPSLEDIDKHIESLQNKPD